jgi:cytochrome c oxidase cbb3-type subunit 3
MRPPAHFLSPLLMIVPAIALGALGCDRAPSPDGLKDWTAADHDGEKKTGKQGPKGDGGGAPQLVELTWRNQCQSCHGPTGHGDGPQGPMVKAQDLSREDWQSKISDAEIATVIATGKGRMPKFELPAEVVSGLVVRVRSFRGR